MSYSVAPILSNLGLYRNFLTEGMQIVYTTPEAGQQGTLLDCGSLGDEKSIGFLLSLPDHTTVEVVKPDTNCENNGVVYKKSNGVWHLVA